MSDWLDALVRLRGRGVPATLVSVVSAKGSVPRGPGTRMVVTADAVEGTIGGGHLELTATRPLTIQSMRGFVERGGPPAGWRVVKETPDAVVLERASANAAAGS